MVDHRSVIVNTAALDDLPPCRALGRCDPIATVVSPTRRASCWRQTPRTIRLRVFFLLANLQARVPSFAAMQLDW